MEPTQEELSILSTAKPYTMTSGERLLHTIRTVRQLDKNNIKGDIVECGVWKGGHPIAAYLANTNTQRHFWLYDTFDGMTIPTQHDYKIKQKTSLEELSFSSRSFRFEPRTARLFGMNNESIGPSNT